MLTPGRRRVHDRRVRRRPRPVLRPDDPPVGRRRTPAADAVLPSARATAVVREGDRGRTALPRPVPAPMAAGLRPPPSRPEPLSQAAADTRGGELSALGHTKVWPDAPPPLIP